jgi:hypothetical protein
MNLTDIGEASRFHLRAPLAKSMATNTQEKEDEEDPPSQPQLPRMTNLGALFVPRLFVGRFGPAVAAAAAAAAVAEVRNVAKILRFLNKYAC